MSGFTRRGRDYYGGERHPICGPWFAGVPVEPPLAMVIGSPYKEAWPEAATVGETVSQFVFVEIDDWKSGANIGSMAGRVPPSIAQQSPGYSDEIGHPNWNRTYPERWPLGAIFDESVW